MAKKKRVDQVLVERGLANSLDEAKRLVMAGKVLSRNQKVMNASQIVDKPLDITLSKEREFVSRGGEKLQAAFNQFPISVKDQLCADIGASTGGFTDCLLKNGARLVYAIDVGYGILDWRLRNDERVAVLERTNARTLADLPEPISFFSADVSFISLNKILPGASKWYGPGGGEAVILIKPQFEATREEAARGAGVIEDPAIHQRILTEVLGEAELNGYLMNGLIRSPLLGPEGNVEFLAWLDYTHKEDSQFLAESFISPLF